MESKDWSKLEAAFQASVRQAVQSINDQTVSRALRASNAMRNSALVVLKGERSGRVYKKPGTYGGSPSKATKDLKKSYGHKLRGGQLYQASAPGEAPAVRLGSLRQSWGIAAQGIKQGKRYAIVSAIRTDVPYAGILEAGSPTMAPRPYRQRIIDHAKPKIVQIFGQPFHK